MTALLQVMGVSKSFPGVKALDKVDLEIRKGEVHALVGENGAGKSTLMKILSGVYQPDEGRIAYKGRDVVFYDAHESQSAGIGIIYQELNLIPHLTVAQNIFIGKEPTRGLFIDSERMNREASILLDRLHMDVAPDSPVRSLPVSKQQMVEVAKALSYNSDILIMDEPTSALTEAEIEQLFKVIRLLRDNGAGIIYISHRLEELRSIADRVTVFRDGQRVSTDNYADVGIPEIVKRMVGREMTNKFPPMTRKPGGRILLEAREIRRRGVADPISFRLRAGEILGVAGLMGSGRTELARILFGADPREGGGIFIDGREARINTPIDAIKAGIGYLSEDRKSLGLALGMSVKDNVTLAYMDAICGAAGWVRREEEKAVSGRFVKDLDIRTPGLTQLVKNLSGGNQQKVVIAKWLFRNANILIFDEPTKGIDVGAKFAIYELMNELAERGAGIMMISSELPEILGMSDRIMVMCAGGVATVMDAADATQEKILHYAAGLA